MIFTFGTNHVHPITGAGLGHRFVVIDGEHEAARIEMARRFGQKWSHMYETEDAAGVEKYRLEPLTGDEALGALGGLRMNEYQERASTTAVYKDKLRVALGGETSSERIAYCAMALCGEAGEVANDVKKELRDYGFSGKNFGLARREKIREELGDVLWYVAMLAQECGWTLEQVAALNIAKLKSRHVRTAGSDGPASK